MTQPSAPTDTLETLALRLLARRPPHPVRVGIDGWCGAGKTTFRRALAGRLRGGPRPVVELDSDGFHNPRAIRYRQGRDSARGYSEDAYDFTSLVRLVLRPFGPGGDRAIVAKVHDLASDERIIERIAVPDDAIVLFDATFLQRGGLRRLWDEVLYLDVDDATSSARGVARDAAVLGGTKAARAAYERRYLAACRISSAEERPAERASIVIDNRDIDRPVVRSFTHSYTPR